ncbi:MAG: amidase [Pigmentiphaga sp.]|nr:amidase [Pigmentiphaga sp.]
MKHAFPSLRQLAEQLQRGQLSSEQLASDCLARAADPRGEGQRVFIDLKPDQVLEQARQADRLRAAGKAGPYAGIPVSIKDLFDVKGEVTRAGSTLLADQPPAEHDATCVARLRNAGMVLMGRTNMTEFAYSGLGLNAHYGTPKNAFDRETGRIPGGSSSGAAISVTDGMAAIGLGSDTGGSCRIPAALNGLVGFKSTASSIPQEGGYPLSVHLDSYGGIGQTVDCCAILHNMMSQQAFPLDEFVNLQGLRIGLPQRYVLSGMDEHVARHFEATLQKLARAGVVFVEQPFDEFDELPAINAKGGFPAYEAYQRSQHWLATRLDEFDPRVSVRIQKGAQQTAADFAQLQRDRQDWIQRVNARFDGFDFIAMPTVPRVAPTLAELADDDAYGFANLLMLRNPTVINFLDGCSISLPCPVQDGLPVGLMVSARHGEDRRLLALARSLEAALLR